ncbi:unnamed protein product [Rhizophagus irregularis]|nr:unnamed protein product [Rhizophagus irregularis]
MSRNHEYFERNPETWSIIDFLNECKVEPYDAKIDKYTKSLKAIANDKQGERTKKAQSLLDSFMLGLQPDRTKAKEWERKRAQKQVHIHQPNLNAGTVVNEISGGTFGSINGKAKKRDHNESDDDFLLPKDHLTKGKKQLSLSRKNKESVSTKKAKIESSLPGATPGGTSSLEVPTNSNDDGSRTPPPKPLEETRNVTTPQKPKLCTRSFQYLSKHISVSINEQGLIMKVDQDVVIPEIPDEIQRWLINALSSEKDRFISAITASLNPEHKFQKMCRIILYDFFFMTSEGLMDRNIGERKYTVEQIVPLFKAIQSVYREYKFDWIEVQLECIKDMKLLFPNFDLTLNKADGVCMKASNNKEIVFIDSRKACLGRH